MIEPKFLFSRVIIRKLHNKILRIGPSLLKNKINLKVLVMQNIKVSSIKFNEMFSCQKSLAFSTILKKWRPKHLKTRKERRQIKWSRLYVVYSEAWSRNSSSNYTAKDTTFGWIRQKSKKRDNFLQLILALTKYPFGSTISTRRSSMPSFTTTSSLRAKKLTMWLSWPEYLAINQINPT